MQPLDQGSKIRILPSYCLRKRHGQEFVVLASRELYGKLYYSLVGEDWLVCSEDVELYSVIVIEESLNNAETGLTAESTELILI